jgi:hypothetical protein
MFKIKWKKLLILSTFWLCSEIVLNFIGCDDLADYGEYIFEKPLLVSMLIFENVNTFEGSVAI